jgi:lysophospholipase L1-like esterase
MNFENIINKIKIIYHYIALILLNTLILIILINVLVSLLYFFKNTDLSTKVITSQNRYFNNDGSPIDNGKRDEYEIKYFDYRACDNVPKEYVSEVLDDFYNFYKLGLSFQPWVQLAEPVFKSKHINVELDEKGFPIRRTLNVNNGSKKKAKLFILGGSTTFGYLVSDEQTWPSYLSKILNDKAKAEGIDLQVEVVNFGRAYYYPSMETALIQDILRSGYRPSLVIFMDGVNLGDMEDMPPYSEQIQQIVHNIQHGGSPAKEFIANLPIVKILRSSISNRLNFIQSSFQNESIEQKNIKVINDDYIKILLNRFNLNKSLSKAICEVFNEKCLFFIQPDAFYNYPLEFYRKSFRDEILTKRNNYHYPLYEILKKSPGYVYLGDLFNEYGYRRVIIDNCHYSPSFNKYLAEKVASYIDLKNMPLYRLGKAKTFEKRSY